MKTKMQYRRALIAGILLICSLSITGCVGTAANTAATVTTTTAATVAPLTISGNQLQIATSTLLATFKQAALISLQNRMTNETYIATPGPNWVDLPLLQNNGQTLTAGNWSMNPDGASASIQFTDSQRTLTMTAGVVDDDLFLRFAGSSTAPGVVGASWGISGLNLNPGRLIIPALGGTYFDATSTPDVEGFDYPVEWENQMVIYQGKAGNVLIYARDPGPSYKRLLVSRPTGTLDLSLEMFAPGPWPSSLTVSPIEWRMHGFSGSWTQAADSYKSYMSSLRPFTSTNSAQSWVKAVRAVEIFETLDPTLLDALAAEVVPNQTVLLLTTWRQQPFDIYYPDYTPDPAAISFVARARQLGFRIMLHVNLLGISEVHPEYANFTQCQIKTADTLQPTGWLWDSLPSGDPRRFAYISPSCSSYRQLFINQIAPAIAALKPDALHLDAGGAIINDGNGLIEGLNSMQGMIQLHKDILATYPNLVLGGESTNEVIGPYNWLAQRWPSDSPPHSISSYLMSSQVFFYGFLDQPDPDEDSFANYLSRYEGFGVVPVNFIVDPTDLDQGRQRTHLILAYQKMLQTNLYSPDWTGDWTGLEFRQSNAAKTSTLSVKDDGTFVTLQQGSTIFYQRAHGASSYTTPFFVDNWPAYDDGHLVGMTPEQQYWLTSTAFRPSGETHLLTVPANMEVGIDTLRTSQYSIFEIDGADRNWFDFVEEFAGAKLGTIYNLTDYGVIDGAVIGVGSATVKGVFYDSVIFEHPPYLQALGGSDFIEYSIPIPVAPKVSLSFNAGIADGNSQSDGVLFGVQINGQTAWKATVLPDKGWTAGTVDLTSYAGTTVKLRLLTHPGLALNPAFDSACWNALSINTDFSTTANVQLQLATGSSTTPQFTSNVTLSSLAGNTASISLPVPAKFSVFTTQPATVAIGQSLLTTPMTVWETTGGLPMQAVYETSGSIGPTSSGGVTKTAVAAIPPRDGQTILSSAVTLPSNATTISFGYGLADAPAGQGAITNYSGVTFIVRANGTQLLSQAVNTVGWSAMQVDVSQFAGKPVVFELIVDANQDQLFDFAYFTDLTIH